MCANYFTVLYSHIRNILFLVKAFDSMIQEAIDIGVLLLLLQYIFIC